MHIKKIPIPYIDTIPLPDLPVPGSELDIKIPPKLLQEFKEEVRLVFKPHIWGIPVPEAYLQNIMRDKGMLRELNDNFEIMLIPRMK